MKEPTHRMTFQAAIAFSLVVFAQVATAATWNKAAGGTYDWNDTANWTSGTLPTATTDALLNNNSYRPTGNQTINGDGVARSLDLHNNAESRFRTFTGDITASNLMLRVGTMNVEGTLTLTGGGQTYSIVGASANGSFYGGTLDIRNGGAVVAEGVHALSVGRRADTQNNDAGGRVLLREGGRLVLNPSGTTANVAGLMLGRNDGNRTGTYGASYIQFGGEATVGRFLTGYEKNTFATIAVLGGSLDLPYISPDTRFRIGHSGYGVFQLLGGEVSVGTNRSSAISIAEEADRYAKRAFCFEVGSGNKLGSGLRGAHFYANGGSFSSKIDFTIQGPTWDYTGVAPACATIDGTACVTSRTVRVGESLNDGLAALNLNGGVLATDALYAQPGRAGRSVVNANGGKLAFPASALQTQGLNIDAINLYEGGLEIECGRAINLGNAATNVLLRTPGGYGVEVASFTDVGSSYSVPWIEITGGSGSGASAMALVNFDTDTTTNAVMVCRGEGYAAGDSVLATIYRPHGTTTFTTERITLSLSENKPGTLVKTGGYNLNLFAQPEFAGTYEVRQGYVIQSTAAGVASPNVAAVVVGGTHEATFQAGSGNDTAVEANWNPVNPAATLTLGTAFGPGRLRVPGGADEQPFRQTFASLSVNGTDNEIVAASTGAGTALSFGAISCAEGSQLTIPDPKSTFKVYCTGMPAGTALQNIVFADDTIHTAMVGDGGQLVPMPLAFLMVVR